MRLEEYFSYSDFRPGQRELASHVYEACKARRFLVAEAMSGLGKTAAVLCGTLCAADELQLKIIYACRTKREVQRVTEEISRLQQTKTLRAAALFSKFDYCLLKKSSNMSVPQSSFKWYCNFNVSNNLCSYFMNLSLLGPEVRNLADTISFHVPAHNDLLERGERLHVCPYELSKLAMSGAEVVVIPYHYLFDDAAKSLLLSSTNCSMPGSLLILDEAHNLREVMRSMSTTSVSPETLATAVAEAEALSLENLASSLRELDRRFKTFLGESKGWYINKESFVRSITKEKDDVWLSNLALELTTCAGAAWYAVAAEKILPASVLKVGAFLLSLASTLANQEMVLTTSEGGLSLTNANPGERFAKSITEFYSTVLLSATINPSKVFLQSIGMDIPAVEVFRSQATMPITVRTVIDVGVTSKFKSRNPEMYRKITFKLLSIMDAVKGGAGIFFPSYAILRSVSDEINGRLTDRIVVSENRGLSNQEANELMEMFKSARRPVLLAVQGGRFSEGEDFRGDLMDVSVVVGLSLPPPTPTLYAEYAYLKQVGVRDSYLLLSLLPALRKAFQAAGRHLRNPGKRGMVFLLDSRFDSHTIIELMPSWMKHDIRRGDFSRAEIEEMVTGFELG
ncbi:MAG: ATP-dependent DNA helicase [Thaumarchaeota archaeon]|nr:ATP-dependent DNA helicase [Nitrososphaerota archaeon]